MARSNKVKKANTVTEYTPEQIQELKKCMDDPVYFARKYVMIQHPKQGAVPFELYDYQIEMFNAFRYNRYNIILSARQTGKSTTSAIYLLWYAIFHPDKNILIASNKNKGAMEMIHRIRYAYENLPMWLKPGVTDDGWNKHNVAFDNDSRIDSCATSEDSGRGMSISLLYLDEFAFVKPGIQDEFWTSILPTLSTGGSCIMSSTPNGDVDLFAQLWRSAEVGKEVEGSDGGENLSFEPMHVAWDRPPGRDDKFKRQQIELIGELKWRQEYLCEFLSSDALLVDSILLQQMSNKSHESIGVINDVCFWENIKQGETYLIGVDPSTGTSLDFSVIQCFHFPSMNQVAEYRSNTMSSPEIYAKLKWMIRQFESKGCTVYFSVENNGVGEGLIALYQNDEQPPQLSEFVSEEGKNRLGMTTTKKTKMSACLDLRLMIEKGTMQIHSSILMKELKSFVRKKQSYEAQIGSTDDVIMATLICIRLLKEIAMYEQDAFDKLYSVQESEYDNNEEYDEFDDPLPMSIGEDDDTSGFTPL